MILAEGAEVRLRRIAAGDLAPCAVVAETGFWTEDAGAVALETDGRLVGTMQYYQGGPGCHGHEIGD